MGVAGAGAESDVPVDPGVAGRLPKPCDEDPMLYDWPMFVLEKKEVAAANMVAIVVALERTAA